MVRSLSLTFLDSQYVKSIDLITRALTMIAWDEDQIVYVRFPCEDEEKLKYNYHNSGHYAWSCLLFKTKLRRFVRSSQVLTGSISPLRAQQVNVIVGLWRWYINITITILDIIHRPVFYLKHDVSETGFYLRLKVGTETESSLQNVTF
jgi:hypothetical protein